MTAADVAWCVENDGDLYQLFPFHDWTDWQDRPADLSIQPGRQYVIRLRWCQRCRKYEAERGGPAL